MSSYSRGHCACADVQGCGNGKYMDVNKGVVTLGSDWYEVAFDLASPLTTWLCIAGASTFSRYASSGDSRSSSATTCRCRTGPMSLYVFMRLLFFYDPSWLVTQDNVISIAVLHHLSTPERRLAALKVRLFIFDLPIISSFVTFRF